MVTLRTFAAQGPQDHSLEAGLLFYYVKTFPSLRHGTLAHHLAGDDKRRAHLVHHDRGLLDPVDPAVETGLTFLAESELSSLEHVQILLALLFDPQRNGKGCCTGFDAVVAQAEAGIER